MIKKIRSERRDRSTLTLCGILRSSNSYNLVRGRENEEQRKKSERKQRGKEKVRGTCVFVQVAGSKCEKEKVKRWWIGESKPRMDSMWHVN